MVAQEKRNRARDARRAAVEKTLPPLNGVVPAGVRKNGTGKKRGKVFVEDKAAMQSILAMVNDVKESQIAEKLEKNRQLEALRELRREEQEKREEARRNKLDNAKDAVRRKRSKGGKDRDDEAEDDTPAKGGKKDFRKKGKQGGDGEGKKKKSVSFA